jgi:hypothetical protein
MKFTNIKSPINITRLKTQTSLLQTKTLYPSKGGIGRRLNKPKKRFTFITVKIKDKTNTDAVIPGIKIRSKRITKKTNAITKLERGPAKEIIPFSFLVSSLPQMYTAPGAANTNPPPVTKDKTTAKINPDGHIKNRALQS